MRTPTSTPAKTRKNKSFWSRKFIAKQPSRPGKRLGFEFLEDRITPESRTFGTLFFDAGNAALATGPVQISLAIDHSHPVIQFDKGAAFNGDGDTFTTADNVRIMGNGTWLQVLSNTSTHTFKTSTLDAVNNPGASGVTVKATETSGVTVPIFFSAFTPDNIKIASLGSPAVPAVQMTGSLGFSGFDQLSVPLPSGATAQVGSTFGSIYSNDFETSLKDKKFTFKKIEVSTQDVKVGYNSTAHTFYFDGTAKISNVVSSKDKSGKTNKKTFELVSAQFGDATGAHHGIEIGTAGLTSAYVSINGEIELKGLRLGAKNLTMSYDSNSQQLQFSGGISVELNSSISFSAELTLPVAINLDTGDVSLPQGLGIKGSLMIGTFGATADIKYVTDTTGNYSLDAHVDIDLRGFTIGGSFTIVNGTLTSIGLSFDATGPGATPIALGPTGLNITKFSGEVNNLNNVSQIEVTGSVTVVFGKTVHIIDTDYSIFDATASFKITPHSVHIDGTINLVEGILGKGSGAIDIDWDKGQYSVTVDAELLDVFHFNGSLAFDNTGNITFSAMADVHFPSSVPFVGGQNIISANVYLQIRPGNESNSYVAAWTKIGGSFTLGFLVTFNKKVAILDHPLVSNVPYVAPPRDAAYPQQVGGNFTVAPEAGVDGYFIRVTNPRFADSHYDGSNDYLLLFNEDTDPNVALSGNTKHTLNPGSLGDLFNRAAYSFAIKDNTAVPHEPGQVSSPGGRTDADAAAGIPSSERIIFVPKQFFAGSGQTIFGGTFKVMLLSKGNIQGTTTFSIAPRYQAPTARATSATVDPTTGVTSITVTGTAFGSRVNNVNIDIIRSNPTNPFLGVLATSVTLDPNNPGQYDPATGAFTVTATWNGLPDLVAADRQTANYAFFALINDGGNPLAVVDPLTTQFTNAVTPPSPIATIALANPSGQTPDLTPVPFVKLSANAGAPGGFTGLFNANPASANHIAIGGSGLAVATHVTVSVDRGGYIGKGNVATVLAAAQTTFEFPDFASPSAAAAFLNTNGNGVRFVATSDFTGKSMVTVTVNTTTTLGTHYSQILTIPVLSNPFFIDRNQGLPVDTQGLFGREDSVFYGLNPAGGYQFNFAANLAPQGSYHFALVSGNLRGLSLSASGLLSGTPTSASDLPVNYPQDRITIGVFDDKGNSDTMDVLLNIAKTNDIYPKPYADTVTTSVGQALQIDVLANDRISDYYLQPANLALLNPLVYSYDPNVAYVTQQGGRAFGSQVNGRPTVYYTPPAGFVGVDTFQYAIQGDLTSPTRLATVTVYVADGTPPAISAIANQRSFGGAVGPIAFAVYDAQTPVGNLTVTATSSNSTLFSAGNIVFDGSGGQRTLTLMPDGGAVGTATITVTVADGSGFTANTSFTFTVVEPVPLVLEQEFSIGRDKSSSASVELHNPDNSVRYSLTPFGANFTGGIRTASGDFNGDGIADLVCASGPGMPGTIRIYDGSTQQQLPLPETVAGGGLPFGSTFTKGIIVATGDLNGDGRSDLIITAEAGGGARVRIFDSTGSGFVQRSDFIALIGGDNKPDAVKFRGGSRATVSDINGDGVGDLIWAAGAGGGPRVATFDGTKLDGGSNVFYKLTGDFFVLGTNLRDGAYISGGDVNGDGVGDIIAGGGSGAPPQVVGYSGISLMQNLYTRFLDFNFGTNSGQGIRVAVKDLNNDNVGDLIVGSAPGAGSRVAAFNGKNLLGSTTGSTIFDFNAFPGFSGGVFVG